MIEGIIIVGKVKLLSPSKRVKDFLVKILEEEDQDDRTAQKADQRCQKIYDRIHELVLEKDELKRELEAESNREEQAQLQANISRIEREFNELLNVLSLDSMNL